MGLEREIAQSPGDTPEVVTLVASTATQLTTARTSCARGIVITAHPSNGSAIYVGTDDDVTDGAKWFAIIEPAFGPVLIPVADASSLWVYTTGSSQKFGWCPL